MKLAALGDSFRSVSRLLQVIRNESGITVDGGTSYVTVPNYAVICMTRCLERLFKISEKIREIPTAFDCSTHQSRTYLDVRARLSNDNRIKNYHLIALPIFESFPDATLSDLTVKFLCAFFLGLESAVGGLATDCDRSMTGRNGGVVTRIEQMLPGPEQVWCGLYQLELGMQAVFQAAFGEKFLGSLTKLIGY